MPAPIKYIAQAAMDEFYQNYGDNTSFFDIEDFIRRVATVIAEFYQKSFNEKYQESRQDSRAGEVVAFDQGFLMQQELLFEKDSAPMTFPAMSFVNDKSGVAYQEILPLEPANIDLERTSISELWQTKYVPHANRVFWYPLRNSIQAVSAGGCTIKRAMLLYIPAIMDECGEVLPDALVPDGVADYARTTTVGKMRELANGVVVKEANDENNNKPIQAEANNGLLKG